MAPTAEQRKADLIDKVVSEARARVAPNLAESVEQFIRRYFGVVSPDDIIYTAPETLLGGALSLWELGAQRQKGVPKVRLFNPTAEKNGWGLEHTVIEIVNDDMPFLVDSVTAEINARERKIHLLLHPVARVRRDAEGNRVEITDTQHAPTDAVSESYMHIEVDQETDEAELETLRASIEKILARVRMAVADFPKMRERLQEDIAELESGKLPMPAEEVAEAREFLKWLDQGNFVFLGYRRYRFETRDGQDFLPPDAESGLGIRRSIHSESVARGGRALSKEDSDYARRKNLLIIIKADSQSVIHKRVPMDRIGIKRYDAEGNLIGEDRFLGLFTSRAYSRSPREIPTLRLKARRVEERAGLDPHSHNGKALAEILETFPRDEFFQITDADLFDIAKGILLVQERQRVALFTRWDVFHRFVACYVYVPRDQYTPDFKERARAILEEGFEGRDTQVVDYVTESALARGLFIVRTPNGRMEADTRRIEAELNNAASTWSDHLRDTLIQNRGEEAGIELQKRYKRAFPAAYQERFTPDAALFDMQHVETALATGGVVVDLYRHRSDEKEFHFKIIHTGQPVALSEIMPRLENMGLRVESEVPYVVHPHGAQQVVRIRDFSLSGQGMQDDLEPVKQKFQETFLRVWRNEVQNDGFNRLVLAAELEWHEIVVLRAYAKYIRQIGLPVAEQLIQQTLAKHPNITRQLIDLFRNHFDPVNGPAGKLSGRELAGANIRAQIEDALNSVTNTDEDSVLRTYVNLIDSTLRTNYYQRDSSGNRKAYISFKLDSQAVRNLPAPRPLFEIFVYSPQMEGIHLRGGKVARGGLRWSDRRLDFRTEILGLMKAQNVKNVVIVPMGSKGGFVVKNPSADRETFQREGVEAYRTLLRGMLDITDNYRGTEVIPPPDVVRRDPDDPYLVVAADKGTATFSDYANAISAEYGFWLGDAFASGGSAGYDHKAMGITAKGGWEAVKRHFRELGQNIQEEDFTVVGVGDMSGDVFGNAMLLSPHIRLLAAFNHSHIFLDPNPNRETTFAERQRMFDQRLNWNGFNTELLSPGGAIFDRKAKTLTVSEEVQRLFELPARTTTPADLMKAILRARADLLWLGGIGTYVKATHEDHADAADRANDAVRINGNELRVRVVGEGANLGFTQKGRIEFALAGGKLNTDAIDNSAGVDTSDHEVNIKILLYDAIERGELRGEDRNSLLASMTDEVAHLVLRDNYEQTQAISITHALGESVLDEQARFMRALEKAGKLDRTIEGLPDEETLADRHASHIGLTRPEIAIILAYSKIVLFQDLLQSDLPDDPLLVEDLLLYFPTQLRERFRGAIERHRLRREIIGTYVTNGMNNRVRPTLVTALAEETGKPTSDVARAFTIIREAFDLRTIWRDIEALDNKLPAAVQIDMMANVGTLLERAMRWLLRSGYEKLDIAAYVNELRPRIAGIQDKLQTVLPKALLTTLEVRESELMTDGIPEALAHRVASLDVMSSAMDIVRISQKGGAVEDAASVYFTLGARFGLDRLRFAAQSVAAETPWQKAALSAVVDDLFQYQSILAARVIAEAGGNGTEPVEAWLAKRARAVERVDQTLNELRNSPTVDLAMLTVASRQLRALVES